MTRRERKFIECYQGNAAQAAVVAGYAPRTARQAGARLLTKDNIRRALEVRNGDDPVIWSRRERQQFWTQAAGDPKLDMRDRLKASELLGRSEGDFLEKRLLKLAGNGQPTLAQLICGSALALEAGDASASPVRTNRDRSEVGPPDSDGPGAAGPREAEQPEPRGLPVAPDRVSARGRAS